MSDTGISILIVDDARFSTTIIKKNLQAGGFINIQSSDNASSALSIIQEQSIDMVIADWLMPDMDGIELTKRIRQHDEASNHYTYVVMLTARDGVEALKHAFTEGIDDFVNKSAMQQQLVPRVMAGERIVNTQNRLLKEIDSLLAEKRMLVNNNEKLKERCTLDSLTGLGNRNYCIKKLMDHLKHSDARGGATCFVLLKIGDTEQFQQDFPPRIISELLLGISRRLKSTVRPLDDLARIDKYTFAIVTHQSELNTCVGASFKRIKDALNNRSFETSMGFQTVRLEMSISAASLEVGLPKADILIRLAMKAMESSLNSNQIEHIHYQQDTDKTPAQY
ncbi:MAG: response regulator [Sinobacterium sp.]|nr:response regulator [Sinobacterium sp.]